MDLILLTRLIASRLLQRRSHGLDHVRSPKDMKETLAHAGMNSLKDNEAAFNRYKIRPRVMINVAKIDLETEIFGTTVRERSSRECNNDTDL